MLKLGRWTKCLLVGVLLFGLLPGWNAGLAAAEGQAPGMEWERRIEGNVRIIDVQQLSNGGYTSMGAAKEGEVYLDRTDAQGNLQGSKTVALSENGKSVTIESVQHTRDGGYIVGGTFPLYHWRYRGYYIAKMDGNGEIQWKVVDDSGAYGTFHMIRETNDGGFIYVEF
ncbi:MAG: repeat protein, partial [Paenibacillus sp.]|nr:repeat protein [Paenibacillus sp.]